jgi:hypothetical protein
MVAGCRHSDMPTLGQVRGRVTVDGKPAVRAMIAFQPKMAGRESFACTDDDGKYELKYLGDLMGAGVGENSVRISMQRTPDPRTEKLPSKYNTNTTLKYEVKPGNNDDVNFDLSTK